MTDQSNNMDYNVGVTHPQHWEAVAGGSPVEDSKLVPISELTGYQLDLVAAQILAESGRLKSIVVHLGPGYVVANIEVTEAHWGAQPKAWRPRVDSKDILPLLQELSAWDDADPVESLRTYVRSNVGEFARARRWIEPARQQG
ncbi:hypothetical protein [Burkholderia territorii]|uniref:hypothetical protein n=1 Tax=Burkholderia territorii TaxID=1503055 RepID=UPI0012DAE4F0|nr:hypothetical protein [Burkholderia territorii]